MCGVVGRTRRSDRATPHTRERRARRIVVADRGFDLNVTSPGREYAKRSSARVRATSCLSAGSRPGKHVANVNSATARTSHGSGNSCPSQPAPLSRIVEDDGQALVRSLDLRRLLRRVRWRWREDPDSRCGEHGLRCMHGIVELWLGEHRRRSGSAYAFTFAEITADGQQRARRRESGLQGRPQRRCDAGPRSSSTSTKASARFGSGSGSIKTGSYTLSGDDLSFQDCGLCTQIYTNLGSDGSPTEFYFATAGAVDAHLRRYADRLGRIDRYARRIAIERRVRPVGRQR